VNFLNLTGLEALAIAIATVAAVVVLFFLKLRRRRIVVGSALLWERVLEERQTNALIEKLRRWLSLLLAATIALLIILSAGRPYLGSGDEARPVAVVVDTSASMLAMTPSGETRWELALAEAERLVESAWTPAGIIVADTSGRVLTPVTEDADEAIAALLRMSPGVIEARFPQFSTRDLDVYFVTDGVTAPGGVPNDTTIVGVFEPVGNVGITAFEVQVDPTSPSGFTAFLEVTNFSPGPENVGVAVTGVGGIRVIRTATLQAGESWDEFLSLDGFRGGGIQARVTSDADGFALDDVAYGYLPARGELEVTLVTRQPESPLAKLLALAPEVQLTVTSPGEFRESVADDAYIFDGTAPREAPERPSLVFGMSDAAWLPRVTGSDDQIQLSSWDDEHPVMRFIPVDDLRIDRAGVVDPGDWTVVASSGETPLILANPANSTPRFVALTFGLDDSDFPFHLGFPILVENTLSWFSGETLPRVSGIGSVELAPGTSAVAGLDGTALEIRTGAGQPYVDLDEPDLLTAIVDGRRTRIAVNLVDPAASDVNGSRYAEGVERPTLSGPGGNELWFPMLLVATLLVAVEWWTYHRRITL
jgi:hypothetical protein